MTDELKLDFRPGVGSDIRYLKNTWLNAFRNGEGVKDVPNAVYFDYEDKLLVNIIPRCSNAKGIIVAFENQGPDATWADKVDAPILGYIVAEALEEGLLVHMVYVKGFKQHGKDHGVQYRQRGIATALLAEAQRKLRCQDQPILYTYRTEACWKLFGFRQALKRIGATYVPYLKYTLAPSGWETGKVE